MFIVLEFKRIFEMNVNKIADEIKNDEIVTVKGYGKIRKSQIVKAVKDYLGKANKFLESGDLANVKHILYGSGVLKELIDAQIQLKESWTESLQNDYLKNGVHVKQTAT